MRSRLCRFFQIGLCLFRALPSLAAVCAEALIVLGPVRLENVTAEVGVEAMQRGVSFSSHKHEVVETVIQRITVYVMDYVTVRDWPVDSLEDVPVQHDEAVASALGVCVPYPEVALILKIDDCVLGESNAFRQLGRGQFHWGLLMRVWSPRASEGYFV